MSSNNTLVSLILADIGEVVEDQQIVFVELVHGALQREIAPRGWSRCTMSVVRVNRTR
jgi:hypothetical protein